MTLVAGLRFASRPRFSPKRRQARSGCRVPRRIWYPARELSLRIEDYTSEPELLQYAIVIFGAIGGHDSEIRIARAAQSGAVARERSARQGG
jgi:hypothetical protein